MLHENANRNASKNRTSMRSNLSRDGTLEILYTFETRAESLLHKTATICRRIADAMFAMTDKDGIAKKAASRPDSQRLMSSDARSMLQLCTRCSQTYICWFQTLMDPV